MADDETNNSLEEPQEDVDALEQEPQDDTDALEQSPDGGGTDDVVGGDEDLTDATKDPGAKMEHTSYEPPKKGFKGMSKGFNLYFLLFMFILLVAAGIIIVTYFQAKKKTSTTLKTQDLTQSTLQQLASSDASVGSAQQVLNIQSSAVFAGKVLVRDGLEVATNLRVGGTTALTSLDVNGTSQLQQVQIGKDLAVTGNAGIQGSLTVSKSLQVSGSGNFSGAVTAPQLTTNSFQLNGDLTLTHHIIAGGPSPSLNRGTALGGGGTASNSGSDTAGTVSINVGAGAGAGCFATINFAAKYNSTPHVLLTPVGSGSGTLDYYVNRSSSNFSICVSSPPAPGAYGFDYFVVN